MKREEPETHRVKFDKKQFEYPITDTFKSLSGKEVLFELHWEHMPVVGPILKHKLPLKSFTLPTNTTVPTKLVMRREIDYEEDW